MICIIPTSFMGTKDSGQESVFLWKVCRNILPTSSALCGWNLNISSNCVLCNNWIEILNHLFLECPFALSYILASTQYIYIYIHLPFRLCLAVASQINPYVES